MRMGEGEDGSAWQGAMVQFRSVKCKWRREASGFCIIKMQMEGWLYAWGKELA